MAKFGLDGLHRLLARPRRLLHALAHDAAGNVLAIMAASIIPLAAFSGSAIDTARLYVVKVRLQQACDSGVLAGRKFMTDTNPATPLDSNAAAQAQNFFNNNFKTGWFQTLVVSFTPTKTSDSQVLGNATATVPMTIMKMFGAPSVAITVDCTARYDVADADIMFVLDTTGSMACTTADDPCGAASTPYTRPDGTTGYHANEESGSKIAGLRSAVLSFYDTLAANIDPSTHIRYGFVTYTSTVNAGYSLPSPSYLVNTKWNYQTRTINGDQNNGSATTASPITRTSSAACNAMAGRTPATAKTYTASGTAIMKTVTWTSANGGTCTVTTQPLKVQWIYAQSPLDVSAYVTGAAVDDPSKVDASQSRWQGCLEETKTTVSSTFDVNNLPPDLDPDLVPAADVDANGVPTSSDTRWRPMWPDVIYYRGSSVVSVVDTGSNSTNPYGDSSSSYPNIGASNYLQAGYVSCGKPVQRLGPLTRAQVSSYVNASDFTPQGGTYHDTGMIWGTRMISPTGVFASDTAAWPGRSSPNRYIVFMTDGQMAPNQNIYGMYGIENNDKRVTGGSFGSDTDYHNARFVAECAAAKARNITVFVVGFGQALNTQLTACASPGQAYFASDNTALTDAFKKIANQVASLRLSQ